MADPGTGRREHQESRADRQQAQLRQAQRLESLGQLAGGIAHDFNNLLAVILSHASFVSAELAVPSGPDWPIRLESARRDLGQITLAAERAASLTRQLLASVQEEVVRPQALLSVIMVGAGGSASKQARGADLLSAARSRTEAAAFAARHARDHDD